MRRSVGYVTQATAVYPDLTVRENLRYFAAVVGASRAQVDELIAHVDLTGEADRLTASLPGGQLHRVSLAVALLGEPEVLVLDEPTVGLDPVLRRSLWALSAEAAGRGVTMVVSSHVMDEARNCDRLLLLRGLIAPRAQLPGPLEAISAVLPLTYAVDAMQQITVQPTMTASIWRDIAVLVGFVVGLLLAGATTLRRRTP